MSCGEEGHILIPGEAAELLRHLSAWSDKLEYLGEYRAKRDAVRIWNFFDGEIGNPAAQGSTTRGARWLRHSSGWQLWLKHGPPGNSL